MPMVCPVCRAENSNEAAQCARCSTDLGLLARTRAAAADALKDAASAARDGDLAAAQVSLAEAEMLGMLDPPPELGGLLSAPMRQGPLPVPEQAMQWPAVRKARLIAGMVALAIALGLAVEVGRWTVLAGREPRHVMQPGWRHRQTVRVRPAPHPTPPRGIPPIPKQPVMQSASRGPRRGAGGPCPPPGRRSRRRRR